MKLRGDYKKEKARIKNEKARITEIAKAGFAIVRKAKSGE